MSEEEEELLTPTEELLLEVRAKAEKAEARVAELEGGQVWYEMKVQEQRDLIRALRDGIGDVDLWETLVADLKASKAEAAGLRERVAELEGDARDLESRLRGQKAREIIDLERRYTERHGAAVDPTVRGGGGSDG